MNRAMLRGIRVAVVLGLCVLAGVYAGWWFRAGDEAAGEAPAASAAGPATGLVDRLPSIELPDLDGQLRNVRDWTGRPLLINFWATWCAPCRREMPLLQSLHDDSPDGLQVIGIAVDRMPAVESYITEAGISYPILVGEEEAMAAAESFGPEFVALPFSVLVAADGSVLGLKSGELDLAELRALTRLAGDVAAGRLSPDQARERFPGS